MDDLILKKICPYHMVFIASDISYCYNMTFYDPSSSPFK